jgi:ribosomal protein S18 acetylase RimI-like enzyme
MKPRKGQFKFKAPIKLEVTEFTDDAAEISASHIGNYIGMLRLDTPDKTGAREVLNVKVDRKHRGKGIAGDMWNRAKDEGLNPKHSENQTNAGRAWAKKVGD